MTAAGGEAPASIATGTSAQAQRTLALAGLAHALHDGYTDVIYVLLPVWQAELGLGYGRLATLRGVYAGAMALLQLPAGRLAGLLGGRTVLASGTALAALGYALAGASGGLLGLAAEPAHVERADLQRRGVAGVLAARECQRPAAYGHVREDADVHAVHHDALSHCCSASRPAGRLAVPAVTMCA